MDAVEVFIGLVNSNCNEIAKSPFLFPCLSTVQIERLPTRHSFVKMLVQLGSVVDNENIKKILYEMVSLINLFCYLSYIMKLFD